MAFSALDPFTDALLGDHDPFSSEPIHDLCVGVAVKKQCRNCRRVRVELASAVSWNGGFFEGFEVHLALHR